ncbi:MAG: hypothetical protein IKP97_03180 [Kiritimatiellae bacterium]|nr:hypothetical protein [Kiritimatiellia bacterium]
MKQLIVAAALCMACLAKAEAPGESANMQLDYDNLVRVNWIVTDKASTQDQSKCVQRARFDLIRGETPTCHGVVLGVGDTRIAGSLIGAQGTIVMSKIDGGVIGACGAVGASRVDGKVMGYQAAAAAKCGILQNGVQAGVAVDAGESKGVQVGIVTHTAKADSRKGIQIGLINFCDNSKVPIFPFVNGPWLFGEK